MIFLKTCAIFALVSQLLKIYYGVKSQNIKKIMTSEQIYDCEKNLSLVSTVSILTSVMLMFFGFFFEATILTSLFLAVNSIINQLGLKIVKNIILLNIFSYLVEISIFAYVILL